MRSIVTRLVLSAVIMLSALAAPAATVGGVQVDDAADVNGQKLVLNGAGVRKKLFIKVYVGALYLPAKQSDAAAVFAADVSRRMVMHFVFSVGKGKMAEAWSEGLEANTPNATAEVKNAFKALSSWMEDMKDGQTITLTYVPGSGTAVAVNGKAKGSLAGKAVADAILATWIGPKPAPGSDFKDAVLGKR
jgi:hypothetical protein